MLTVQKLSVAVDNQKILRNISLTVPSGHVHALMGPNGSGKSTLAYALMGHPLYQITDGSIVCGERDITDFSPHKRAQAGLFLAFQQPPALPGVRVFTFLKEACTAVTGKQENLSDFHERLCSCLKAVGLDESFAERSLNDNFSGGEKKRLELAQMLLLQPHCVILDEIDSGLDIDALTMVGQVITKAREQQPDLSVLIITHNPRILSYVQPDVVHVLCDGRVVDSGDKELVQALEYKGYRGYKQAAESLT